MTDASYALIDQYVLRLIHESTPDHTVWNIEKLRSGKPTNWNYIDGCMLTALLELSSITGEKQYADFVEGFIDAFVEEDGTIRTYSAGGHALDDINEGRVLFPIYERTGTEKYGKACDFLHQCLLEQPRTHEGSFWHKQIYPNQVWLDGLYMAQPYAALYEKFFGSGDYSDIVHQIDTVHLHMRDAKTGLYYHGYDASRTAFWCDKDTGLSQNFWLRAIGWFSVALADLIDILPSGEERNRICGVFSELMEDVSKFSDPESGMYYQLVDKKDLEGNYLESSGSSMIAYAMLKGSRLGVLDKRFAELGRKTFDGIIDRCMSFENGELNLGSICLVAGLGPENNPRRDGSTAYYLSEPIVRNDAKGVAPFLLCYTEVKRL